MNEEIPTFPLHLQSFAVPNWLVHKLFINLVARYPLRPMFAPLLDQCLSVHTQLVLQLHDATRDTKATVHCARFPLACNWLVHLQHEPDGRSLSTYVKLLWSKLGWLIFSLL